MMVNEWNWYQDWDDWNGPRGMEWVDRKERDGRGKVGKRTTRKKMYLERERVSERWRCLDGRQRDSLIVWLCLTINMIK
jgi:hypothetical protein